MLILPSCCRTVGLCTFEAICHKITECARVFTLSIRFKIMTFRDRLSLISEDYFVFSIDSDQTNDLDDALHCRVLCEREGIYEVGIHITDVAHFVKPNTEDDYSARK